MSQELFAREKLVGYQVDVLANAVGVVVGAGALGNNVVQTLSLSGFGELRIIEFDVIEPSNAPRSPLFRRSAALGRRRRSKARELAMAALDCSYANSPVVRYAAARVESLGLGALQGANVIVSAVDSFAVRAWISDAACLLGIPLVEAGFSGSHGHAAAFLNNEPGAPCYRCLNPRSDGIGLSCTLYARGVLAQGGIPATQTIAALAGAYVAEAAIRMVHQERSPLANKMVNFDVREGRGLLITLATDPECPGVHRQVAEIEQLAVAPDEPLDALFDALTGFDAPEVLLPAEYLVEAPCTRCGARVFVHKPDWAIGTAPTCRSCPDPPPASPGRLVVASRIGPTDPLAKRACSKLGLGPRAIVEVMDGKRNVSRWVQLAGSLDDLYVTRRGGVKAALAEAEFTPAVASQVNTVSDVPERVEGP